MSSQVRILYVEDDVPSRMLVRQVLHMVGYQVLEAEDGMAGIRMAQEHQPDLILMDVNMPGLDGYAAATKIKGLGMGPGPSAYGWFVGSHAELCSKVGFNSSDSFLVRPERETRQTRRSRSLG